MKTGGERGAKYVTGIGKIMIATDSAMDTNSPRRAMLISRHHRGVKRVFRSIHDGFSAIDYAGFVRRCSIALAQWILALFGNTFYMIGHRSFIFPVCTLILK